MRLPWTGSNNNGGNGGGEVPEYSNLVMTGQYGPGGDSRTIDGSSTQNVPSTPSTRGRAVMAVVRPVKRRFSRGRTKSQARPPAKTNVFSAASNDNSEVSKGAPKQLPPPPPTKLETSPSRSEPGTPDTILTTGDDSCALEKSPLLIQSVHSMDQMESQKEDECEQSQNEIILSDARLPPRLGRNMYSSSPTLQPSLPQSPPRQKRTASLRNKILKNPFRSSFSRRHSRRGMKLEDDSDYSEMEDDDLTDDLYPIENAAFPSKRHVEEKKQTSSSDLAFSPSFDLLRKPHNDNSSPRQGRGSPGDPFRESIGADDSTLKIGSEEMHNWGQGSESGSTSGRTPASEGVDASDHLSASTRNGASTVSSHLTPPTPSEGKRSQGENPTFDDDVDEALDTFLLRRNQRFASERPTGMLIAAPQKSPLQHHEDVNGNKKPNRCETPQPSATESPISTRDAQGTRAISRASTGEESESLSAVFNQMTPPQNLVPDTDSPRPLTETHDSTTVMTNNSNVSELTQLRKTSLGLRRPGGILSTPSSLCVIGDEGDVPVGRQDNRVETTEVNGMNAIVSAVLLDDEEDEAEEASCNNTTNPSLDGDTASYVSQSSYVSSTVGNSSAAKQKIFGFQFAGGNTISLNGGRLFGHKIPSLVSLAETLTQVKDANQRDDAGTETNSRSPRRFNKVRMVGESLLKSATAAPPPPPPPSPAPNNVCDFAHRSSSPLPFFWRSNPASASDKAQQNRQQDGKVPMTVGVLRDTQQEGVFEEGEEILHDDAGYHVASDAFLETVSGKQLGSKNTVTPSVSGAGGSHRWNATVCAENREPVGSGQAMSVRGIESHEDYESDADDGEESVEELEHDVDDGTEQHPDDVVGDREQTVEDEDVDALLIRDVNKNHAEGKRVKARHRISFSSVVEDVLCGEEDKENDFDSVVNTETLRSKEATSGSFDHEVKHTGDDLAVDEIMQRAVDDIAVDEIVQRVLDEEESSNESKEPETKMSLRTRARIRVKVESSKGTEEIHSESEITEYETSEYEATEADTTDDERETGRSRQSLWKSRRNTDDEMFAFKGTQDMKRVQWDPIVEERGSSSDDSGYDGSNPFDRRKSKYAEDHDDDEDPAPLMDALNPFVTIASLAGGKFMF